MTEKELMILAERAREHSYSPYSNFSVGAALLCSDGKVFTGCNIENASYSPTCCAERTAFFSAVASGQRNFEKIAIIGGVKEKSPNTVCTPCGVCRQVMSEFCAPDFKIILGNSESLKVFTLSEILPFSFEM